MDLWQQNIINILKENSTLCLGAGGVISLGLLIFIIAFILKRFKKRASKSALPFHAERGRDGTKEIVSPLPTTLLPSEESSLDVEVQIVEPEVSLEVKKEAYPEELAEILRTDRSTWLTKLRQGLSKTRVNLHVLKNLFLNISQLDGPLLEQLHETLYRSDFGTAATDKLVALIERKFRGSNEPVSWPAIQQELSSMVLDIFDSIQVPVNFSPDKPTVILIVGVNGVGKTTTIGKLAAHFLTQKKSVLLCAADTYRAAAIEQLQVWADRLQVEMIRHQAGADPAAVAYDAAKAAVSRQCDILLVDTAGRLHNKTELMQELQKINRVLGKDLCGAPHEIWLVVDATAGQNTLVQIKAFKELIPVSGLIVTKLDGTAKGGVLIGATEQFKLPIRYIGVGEKAADLHEFVPQEYVDSLFDI